MNTVEHRTNDELVAGLEKIRSAPSDDGVLEMIVRRPAVDEREVLEIATLSVADGLVGDTWRGRGSRHTDDGSAEPARQITIMNARAIALFAGDDRDQWALAGDQLYVDFDLSIDNLPPGSRLRLGAAEVEVSVEPHTGCHKFADRFGIDAARFVNSSAGRQLNLRGINTRVLTAGEIRAGDPVVAVFRAPQATPEPTAS